MREFEQLREAVKLPYPVPKKILHVLGRIYLASMALVSACTSNPPPNPTPTPDGSNKTQEFFLPFNGLSRFTGGPHDSFLKDGISDAIDIAPDNSFPCSPGLRKVLDEPLVVASASGTVKRVGNDKDRNDPYHSIVEIQTADGTIVGEMHLDQIAVSVGDAVQGGETPIGKVSCETPLGGKTDAAHVHVYNRDRQDKQIPIENHVFSGFTVHAAASQYNGTMTKEGEDIRTAISGSKCGPDQASIKNCKNLRNDLSSGAVSEPAVKAPPTPLPPPTPAERAPQTGFTRYNSLSLPYQIDLPADWVHMTLINLPNSEAFFPNSAIIPSLQVIVATERLNSWVNLEDYKNKFYPIQSPAGSLPNVQLTEPRLTRIDGKDAYVMERTVAINKIYMIYAIFIDKGIGWTITLQNNDFYKVNIDQSKAIFNRMAPSIHIR